MWKTQAAIWTSAFVVSLVTELYVLGTTARKDKLIHNAPLLHSFLWSAPISTLEKVSLYNKQMQIKLITLSGGNCSPVPQRDAIEFYKLPFYGQKGNCNTNDHD